MGSLNEPSLDELNGMTDEQLAELGVTREDVDAAVAAAWESGEMDADTTGGGGAPAGDGTAATAGAGAPGGGGAGGAVAAQLSALQKQVKQLSDARRAEKQFAEAEAAEHAFSVIEEKVTALAVKNEELTELNSKLTTENESLKLVVRTGAKPAGAGVESTRLFSAEGGENQHEFQKLLNKHKKDLQEKNFSGNIEAEALRRARSENKPAHEDYIKLLARKD